MVRFSVRVILRSVFSVRVAYSIYLLLPLPLHYFDQRRVYIIDQVDYGVHDRLHIYTCV